MAASAVADIGLAAETGDPPVTVESPAAPVPPGLVPGNALPTGGEGLPRLAGGAVSAGPIGGDGVPAAASVPVASHVAPVPEQAEGWESREPGAMSFGAGGAFSHRVTDLHQPVKGGGEPSGRAPPAAGDPTELPPANPAVIGPGFDSDAPPPPAEAATAGDRGAAPGSTVAVARTDPAFDRNAAGPVPHDGTAQVGLSVPEMAAQGTVEAAPREGAGADALAPGWRVQTAAADPEPAPATLRPASPRDAHDASADRPARPAFEPDQGRSAGGSPTLATASPLAVAPGGDATAGLAVVGSMERAGEAAGPVSGYDPAPRATGMLFAAVERSGVATPEGAPLPTPDGLTQTPYERSGAQGLVGFGQGPAGDAAARASDLSAGSSERSAPPVHVGVSSVVATPRPETAQLPAGLVAMSVASPAGQWGGELGERILWISHRGIKAADIQMDPPELGPLQVQVSSHRDGTSVHFTTHSVVVRDLVEQSLPRLRDMLEASGMNLVNVDVSQQQGSGGRDLPDGGAGLSGHRSVFVDPEHTVVETSLAEAPRGLIDFYA